MIFAVVFHIQLVNNLLHIGGLFSKLFRFLPLSHGVDRAGAVPAVPDPLGAEDVLGSGMLLRGAN